MDGSIKLQSPPALTVIASTRNRTHHTITTRSRTKPSPPSLPLSPHHHPNSIKTLDLFFPKTRRGPIPKPLNSTPRSSGGGGSSGSGSGSDHEIGARAENGRDIVVRLGEALSLGFPLWLCSSCLLALCRPSTFLWVGPNWQIFGLSITMLGMGMTLELDDLRAALLMPKQLAVGFALQYTVMPLSGFYLSRMLKLPPHYAAGLILVACCPGGTASNLVTYLARGNVALSVLMTTASTLTAAVMTSVLTSKLAGQFVAVDPTGLFVSTVQVVLAPVLIGATLNQYCNELVEVVSPLMPFIAVTSVSILGGAAIAQNAPALLKSGFQVVIASLSLHASGFFFGYWFSRMLGFDVSSSRTISIEVGMQNATLGLVLASRHFPSPLSTVPCAVSGICHLMYGSALAAIWRSLPPTK